MRRGSEDEAIMIVLRFRLPLLELAVDEVHNLTRFSAHIVSTTILLYFACFSFSHWILAVLAVIYRRVTRVLANGQFGTRHLLKLARQPSTLTKLTQRSRFL